MKKPSERINDIIKQIRRTPFALNATDDEINTLAIIQYLDERYKEMQKIIKDSNK